jgi:hypothetical protein
MTGGGIRVYALARELGLEPRTVLDTAHRLGYAAPNQLSTLDAVQREAVVKALRGRPPEEPPGVPARLRPRGPGSGAARHA